MTEANVTIAPVSHTTHTIVEAATAAGASNSLTPGEAYKLRGQLGWNVGNNIGRCGRLAILPRKERHYNTSTHLTDRLRETLTFAAVMVQNLPPRAVPFSRSSPRKLVTA